jgi:glycine cleavage system aminomethyltransferase T
VSHYEGGSTQPLFPNVRRSPYFELCQAEGALAYMVYNHMYMPIAYENAEQDEYRALTEAVTLWDVGAERQTQLRGPDALELADYVCTRDLSGLSPGRCRYTTVCDERGHVMSEPIVLMPAADTVWISHGDVDLTLWVKAFALARGLGVEVSEPDVAPMQLQGPRSPEVIGKVCRDVDSLGYYRCTATEIAGVPCIVSRTGWSGEQGYEIFPLGDIGAPAVWTAVREAGRDFDLLVTGPNLSRALEHGITDTHYFVNCDMDPFELGRARLVDLSHGTFIGQDALREASRRGRRRRTVSLLAGEARLPQLTEYWPVSAKTRPLGQVLWAAWSPAIGRAAAIALLDVSCEDGEEVTIHHGEGTTAATVAQLPLVDGTKDGPG